MNKKEMVDYIADNSGDKLTKKQAELALDLLSDCWENTLKKGDKVQWVGVVSMEPAGRNARTGRNPQTGKEIEIPEKVVPKVKPGSRLEDAVEGLPVEKYLKKKKADK